MTHHIKIKIKTILFFKQHFRCYYCKDEVKWKETTLDHVVPLAKGGPNHESNLVMACYPCNQLKADSIYEIVK